MSIVVSQSIVPQTQRALTRYTDGKASGYKVEDTAMSLAELTAAVRELSRAERRVVLAAISDVEADAGEAELSDVEYLARRGVVRLGTGRLGAITPAALETDRPVSEMLVEDRR
jgi:hypothetical protein